MGLGFKGCAGSLRVARPSQVQAAEPLGFSRLMAAYTNHPQVIARRPRQCKLRGAHTPKLLTQESLQALQRLKTQNPSPEP